jgi:WD40 repeat protein/serine/threonine protein kinase
MAPSQSDGAHQERATDPHDETVAFGASDVESREFIGQDASPLDLMSMDLDAPADPSVAETGALTATVRPRDLSRDEIERMTAAWGQTLAQETSPERTIKLEHSQASSTATSLVVKERSIQQSAAAGADYELLDVIGRGGMGVVYAARQTSIDRTVALKMLRPDRNVGDEHRGKFLSEAVVTGDLDHPNIVPIYELGTNEAGALFYSMKRVRGTPWKDVLQKKRLEENLEILLNVADAVAFAHANGVVHRDLKPENVMLGDFGEVLVMDWGLALATSHFRHTEFVTSADSMGGTPAYMAPEMATGPFDRIGLASDIYLLGAMLYEIVTRQRPHTGRTLEECLHNAARNIIQPTPYRGELLEIALRAMATEPEDRFATVQEFQAAVREYQSHAESISLVERASQGFAAAQSAGDYSAFARSLFGFQEALSLWPGNEKASTGLSRGRLLYAQCAMDKGDFDLGLSLLDPEQPEHAPLRTQLEKAQRERDARHRRLRNLRRTALLLAATVLIVVTGAFFWVRAARDAAIAAREQESLARKDAQRAEQQAREAADQARAAQREEALAREKEALARQQAENERAAAIKAQQAEELARIEETKARQEEEQARQLAQYESYLAQIGLAAAKIDENAFDDAYRLLTEYEGSPHSHWEWGRLRYLSRQGRHSIATGAAVETVEFAPSGEVFAAAGRDGVVRFYRPGHDRHEAQLQLPDPWIHAVAFSPDGRLLAVGTSGSVIMLFRVDDREPVAALKGHDDAVVALMFSPDGRRLLTASYDKTARVWDVSEPTRPREIALLDGHRNVVRDAVFSPEGRQIVTVGDDGKAVVWSGSSRANAADFEPVGELVGHRGPVLCAAFSPLGDLLATGGYDNRVMLWDPRTARPVDLAPRLEAESTASLRDAARAESTATMALLQHHAAVRSLSFAEDGRLLVSAADDNTLVVWDVLTGRPVKTLRGHSGPVRSCAFAPRTAAGDARWVVSGSLDGTVVLWNVDEYGETRALLTKSLRGHDDAVLAAVFDASGRRVLTGSRDHTAAIWDVSTGKPLVELKEGHGFLASAAAIDPAGRRLVTAGLDGSVRVWDVRTGTEQHALSGTGRHAVLAISPNGKLVLTGNGRPLDRREAGKANWRATVWSMETGELVREFAGHEAEVSAAAFASDRTRLLTADEAGVARLWNSETGELLSTLRGHTRAITAVAFSPSGRRVLTASDDKSVGQWDPLTGEELSQLALKHPDSVLSVTPLKDNRHVVTTCVDGKIRVWDLERASVTAQLVAPSGPATLAMHIRQWLNRTGEKVERLEATASLTAGRVAEILRRGPPPATAELQRLAAAMSVEPADLTRPQVVGVDIHPDGRSVVAANVADQTVIGWQLPESIPAEAAAPAELPGTVLLELDASESAVWLAIHVPQFAGVLTVGGKEARLWNLASREEQIAFRPHGAVAAVAFSVDASRAATGGSDGSVRLWDAESGRGLLRLAAPNAGRVHAVAFVPGDARRLVTAGEDGLVRIWDVERGELIDALEGHRQPIYAAAITSDGRWLATGSADGSLRIWSLAGGEHYELQGHRGAVRAVAFAADGSRLVSGGDDRLGRVWQIDHPAHGPRQDAIVLSGHTGPVLAVAISSDGSRVLTGSEDTAAKLWDSTTGREVLHLQGHRRGVTAVAFSPDGRLVLTASRDATALVWPADPWPAARQADGRRRSPRDAVAAAWVPGPWRLSAGHDGVLRQAGPEFGEVVSRFEARVLAGSPRMKSCWSVRRVF